jgi:hypothetical protein
MVFFCSGDPVELWTRLRVRRLWRGADTSGSGLPSLQSQVTQCCLSASFDADPDPHPNFHVDAFPDPILSLPIFGKSNRKFFIFIHSSASVIFLVSVIGVKTSKFWTVSVH